MGRQLQQILAACHNQLRLAIHGQFQEFVVPWVAAIAQRRADRNPFGQSGV
jgi:hypothetical protein